LNPGTDAENGTTDARTGFVLDRSAVVLTLSLVSSAALPSVALGGVETPDGLSIESSEPASGRLDRTGDGVADLLVGAPNDADPNASGATYRVDGGCAYPEVDRAPTTGATELGARIGGDGSTDVPDETTPELDVDVLDGETDFDTADPSTRRPTRSQPVSDRATTVRTTTTRSRPC
jgi:hypothetical protein